LDITKFRNMTFLGPHVTWADFPKDTPTVVDTWRCLPFAVMFLLLRELSDITLRPILFKMVEMSNSRTSRKERFGKNAIKKASEAGFDFIFHSCSFVGILIVLWNKPWLLDTKQCWVGWPKLQNLPNDVYWLYMVQLGHYVSQLFSIMVLKDHRYKDKTVMVVHHLVTIILLVGSLVIQTYRIGTLVLLLHDIGDPCVCMMKVLWETGWRKSAENLSVVGIIVWILSRQILFLFWILNTTVFESLEYMHVFAGFYWVNNICLGTLFLFHCWWTWLFIKVVSLRFTQGYVPRNSHKMDDTDASSDEDAPEVKEVGDGDRGHDGKVKVN